MDEVEKSDLFYNVVDDVSRGRIGQSVQRRKRFCNGYFRGKMTNGAFSLFPPTGVHSPFQPVNRIGRVVMLCLFFFSLTLRRRLMVFGPNEKQ
jgi:hypothetical protein